MIKEKLQQIILDNQGRKYESIVDREHSLPENMNKVITLLGPRRSGKTFLLFSLIKRLRQKINSENIIYLNFEDDRIFPLDLAGLGQITEAYYELFPDKTEELVYFFLDEIHVIDKWEKFVRRIYDNENCRIYLCGSSSKLLGKEIATSLRGRSITYEVFPLSFKEYLHFLEIPDELTSKSKSKILHALTNYLNKGSFPETVFYDQDTTRRVLQEYIDLIMYKDVIERYQITNQVLLKRLLISCLSNTANLISISKIYRELKSQGLSIARNTVFEYIGYLEDAFALFTIPLFSRSVAEQNRNPRKLYVIDVGFKHAVSISYDIGKLFETVVFLHIRRNVREVYYYRGKQEVDFCFYDHDQLVLINVCYDLSDRKTREREVNGLLEAMKDLKVYTSTLITSEQFESIDHSPFNIRVIPLWKWLLGH